MHSSIFGGKFLFPKKFCEFEAMPASSQVRRDSEINHKTICLQIDPQKRDNISKDGECETVIFNCSYYIKVAFINQPKLCLTELVLYKTHATC